MFCPNCGKEMKAEDKMCSNCGHHFERKFSDNKVETPSLAVTNHNIETASSDIKKLNHRQKKKDGKKLFAIIGTLTVIIILIIIAVLVFMKENTSSKGVFDKAIGYFFEQIKEIVPEKTNSVSNNYTFKAELELDKEVLESQYYSFINELSFKGNTTVDYEKKLALANVSIAYKEDPMADLAFYASDNTVYAHLGDLFDKYISIPVEEEEYNLFFESLNAKYMKENVSVVLEEVEKALKTSLKAEYFINTTENLTINNKEVDTKKHTLVLDEKTYTLLMKDILTSLNNDKFLDNFLVFYKNINSDILENVNDEDIEKQLKESIEQKLEQLTTTLEENEFTTDNKVYVSLYMNSKDNVFVSFTISYQYENDQELTVLDITKLSNDSYSFEVTDKNNLKICYGQLTLSDTEEQYKIYLNMDSSGSELGTIEIDIDVLKGTINTYVYTIKMDNFGTVKLTLTNAYRYNETVTLPTLSNSILYTELTEEDTTAIVQKLMEKDSVTNLLADAEDFITMFMLLASSMNY